MEIASRLRSLDIVREWLWSQLPTNAPACGPSWELPDNLLREFHIRWPLTYQWPEARYWFDYLLDGFRTLVAVEPAEIPQTGCQGVVMIQLAGRGATHLVAIDYSDDLDHINKLCLDRAACYFKMQYRRGGYREPRIVPGGYASKALLLNKLIARVRKRHQDAQPIFDVYGRFGLNFATGVRTRAVELLNAQRDFHYEGGRAIVRHSRSLHEAAGEKLCIDLPGNGDFCFRLIDYLAVGACILGPRHRTELPIPLIDREHMIFCADDLSDLIPLCHHYLANDAERQRIARNARDYFDRYLHNEQLARYYLHTVFRFIA